MKTGIVELKLAPEDNRRLANLCGVLDENLRQIEAAFDVTIARRGVTFRVNGDAAQAEKGAQAVEHFYNRAHDALSLDDIQLGLVELTRGRADDEDAGPRLRTRRAELRARTPGQADYIENILSHDISFGIGPAGTGKTYLAVACAVDALEREQVKRLILTRPAVEAGERLGFLPGDLTQKVDPYLRPLYDALYDLMGFDKVTRLIERHAIEVAPLAFMRGRTLNHAFIILDEAQNTTPEQMQMFLTRIGFGARAVVTGDPTQVDLPKHVKSGLLDAVDTLANVRGIGFTHFGSEDVVRHPLIGRIVDAYAAKRALREK
ncbi:MAG: phosphate starvation-inducible protein PhoH [Hydrogenophilales bacterium 16-64-46]|nr:MAG: phosphate starvation-inducible protein PhoH [Hydrogenophilales bacterium 12-64-13]OYZ06715.1 MAG: phosphate starvation-inducible protein PhoH [Hydrogenophilales bacterium 16-64-46]OZA39423.1 MAG: phosphate starvation-inducible protein PhoH [Hydrogenophilales bacterium 17-64-34]HQT00980.1 PhoH family protein [Thiobacillus sp.]